MLGVEHDGALPRLTFVRPIACIGHSRALNYFSYVQLRCVLLKALKKKMLRMFSNQFIPHDWLAERVARFRLVKAVPLSA